MPTGYTHNIARNDFTFEDYALTCARAFGATSHQRDSNLNERPKCSLDDEYYTERFNESSALLKTLEEMDDAAIEKYGQNCKDKEILSINTELSKRQDLYENYFIMLSKVNAWQPPSLDHEPLKKFMIEQINISIESDCDLEYYAETLEKVSKMSNRDFYETELKSVISDVFYYKDQIEKYNRNVDKSNQWILDLYKSLSIPYNS